ncbi:MAG: UbiD family decarboxylase, partial [Thaumarchaeota archaeon]|nr:UbiD family decarboxylase [Nitrososphaerota archaeon]
LRSWKEKRKSISHRSIKRVSDAPFMENIDINEKIDVLKFPVPQWHEMDGGRYIGSGAISIMRDEDEDWINLGVYRVQVHDMRTLVIHFDHLKRHGYLIAKKYWNKGKSCPMALVCGEDPALFIAATESSPWGVSEYGIAGWLRGHGIEVIESNLTGLPLPVHSEIVIEGEIPPPEQITELEGPFGEATGYYTGDRRPSPVIRVKRIMYRNDPIISGNAPLRPPYHSTGIPLDAVHLWDDLEKSGIKNVTGVWKPSRWMTVVSMHQSTEDDAKRAGELAIRSRGVYLDRFIVLVDDDIDPTNIHDVLWAISTRCEPSTGITVYPNLDGSTLDPLVSPERSARGDFTHSKAVINACKPFQWLERFPRTNTLTKETMKSISERWLKYLQPAETRFRP